MKLYEVEVQLEDGTWTFGAVSEFENLDEALIATEITFDGLETRVKAGTEWKSVTCKKCHIGQVEWTHYDFECSECGAPGSWGLGD